MPRQNRVTPFGEIIATPELGTLMGNRGVLHDRHGTIRRNWKGTRWIICLLDFKQRKQAVMKPGCYTQLFFLDEATALAAGHRPCAGAIISIEILVTAYYFAAADCSHSLPVPGLAKSSPAKSSPTETFSPRANPARTRSVGLAVRPCSSDWSRSLDSPHRQHPPAQAGPPA
jgi:hypothetical protein